MDVFSPSNRKREPCAGPRCITSIALREPGAHTSSIIARMAGSIFCKYCCAGEI